VEPDQSTVARGAQTGVFLKPLEVLLVEDNPNDVVLVEIALENHGISHTLHVVNDGKAAIDFVKTIGESGGASCPDVFLLDISVPQVNGLEVLGYVRAHAPCRHTPVIVFSSLTIPEEQERLARP
jgi:chemotaxis family two-component system response regulator Rcp1